MHDFIIFLFFSPLSLFLLDVHILIE